MEGMNLTKAQVARRQLGTALALYLDDLDPVSVHTLDCAGAEIAEHLTRKRGDEPFSSHALATFSDVDAPKIRHLRNQFCNAFKHATTHKGEERDDRKLLERFSDLQNDHALFVTWYDYALAQTRCRSRHKCFKRGTLRSIPKSSTAMSTKRLIRRFFRNCQSSPAKNGSRHCGT